MPSRIVRILFVLSLLCSGVLSIAEEGSDAPVKESSAVSSAGNAGSSSKASLGQKILQGVSELFKLNRDEDEAAQAAAQEQSQALFRDIQSLKNQAIDLNAELRLLEEELLFPVNTQVTFFVSLETAELFQLESVRLKLDGNDVAAHLYTDSEDRAMLRGGMHRLHVANLANGSHEMTAVFTGVGPSGRDYERAVSQNFEKRTGARYLQLHIHDSGLKNQPEFQVIEW